MARGDAFSYLPSYAGACPLPDQVGVGDTADGVRVHPDPLLRQDLVARCSFRPGANLCFLCLRPGRRTRSSSSSFSRRRSPSRCSHASEDRVCFMCRHALPVLFSCCCEACPAAFLSDWDVDFLSAAVLLRSPLWMLPASIALAIYIMVGAAEIPSTERTSATSGEESATAPVSGPAPLPSPTSESGDTTEPALEEPSAAVSPIPEEPAPDVPATVAAAGDSGSGSSAPPPEAWGEIMSFLDRPQAARQSALASLPTSDLIRLTLEASATALGRLSWYEGTSVSVSGGDPIRNPPPGRLLLRAAPVAKEPPPRAVAPAPAPDDSEVKAEVPDNTPTQPPEDTTAAPVAVPKVCPLPYPGNTTGPPAPAAGRTTGRPGSSDDPAPDTVTQQTTRPKSSPPDPAPAAPPAPEVVTVDDADDSLWEAAWYGQLSPHGLAPNTYSWRPSLPPLLRSPPCSSREGWCIDVQIPATPGTIHRPEWWPYPDMFCLSPGEHPRWLEQQEPADPLSHLRLRGFCTHSCSRLLRREQGNRCLGLCLRPIMAGERAGHTSHVCLHCRTGR